MTASLAYSQPRNSGALGVICTRSFPAVVGTADMMLKSADVTLVGYEKTGSGFCTAVIRGGYADIKLALEAGVATARQFEQYVSSTILPRPQANLEAVLPISRRLSQEAMATRSHQNVGAIGLIETNGFPALVGAADAMLKSANVKLICYEKTGSGLCTAIVQGTVSNVTVAVEAGMYAAERIGQLNAIMVIPRPLDDLMESLPEPQLDGEATQPLQLPLRVREKQPLLELPELERQPIAIEAPRLLAEERQAALELTQDAPIPEPLELPNPRTDQ
ncbi:carbon dioxide-concentrating mechanism protein CcmK [Synechococcus elongatus]|uniref:Carbon dioxide-concentrating mechanism protein CcmK n=1 Tax=Synechococcus elongatus PCC 11802 TaxID=2283154 RepID=A0AAT9JZX9_SYNEL|nr:carbon dioxide-concentrating mechanism protein CcmK [Synechococcus elongatus]QFZ92907.1 carbon dioxide-concentrating mechanism protein CcmK [Synechococcus elongatus PCC 11802]